VCGAQGCSKNRTTFVSLLEIQINTKFLYQELDADVQGNQTGKKADKKSFTKRDDPP
jgi:hypothetical protein